MAVRNTGEVESTLGFASVSEDTSCWFVGDAVRSCYWLFRERCSCVGWASAKSYCMSVHRSVNVF